MTEIPFIFVFSKNNEVRCLTLNEEMVGGHALRSSGWNHTLTIDPRLWLSALAMHQDSDALDMIKELRGEIKSEYYLR